jgi:hypothetical protein
VDELCSEGSEGNIGVMREYAFNFRCAFLLTFYIVGV